MKQAKVLNDQEVKRVLAVIGQSRHADRNRMAFMVSMLAGLRAREIASLTIGSVMDSQGKLGHDPVAYRRQRPSASRRRQPHVTGRSLVAR